MPSVDQIPTCRIADKLALIAGMNRAGSLAVVGVGDVLGGETIWRASAWCSTKVTDLLDLSKEVHPMQMPPADSKPEGDGGTAKVATIQLQLLLAVIFRNFT
jgi:hypothetical protein